MIVAFDLDGTLCNIEHRLHYIHNKPSNWPEFFRACVNDAPIYPIIRIAEAMWNAGHTVEIWSGRSDIVKPQTEACLKQWAVKYHTLRMRKDGDYRVDNVVKDEWFEPLPEHERPAVAFDDRQQVVDMWRRRGVLCCQVAPGNF